MLDKMDYSLLAVATLHVTLSSTIYLWLTFKSERGFAGTGANYLPRKGIAERLEGDGGAPQGRGKGPP